MKPEVLSTYRVQLNADFTFDDVAALAPYLADLGITHVYCSPYLQAAEGSEHGYDVVEHPRLNEELGGREGFERMVDSLEATGLGHIVDVVPNHVSTEGNNRWWSVLKHGRNSRHADWFDIDWDYLDGKVCAPLLGDDLDACLERGEIQLDTSGPEPVLRYFDHVLPVAPETDLDAPLEEIVASQHYWLVEWKRGNRNLNYRRFFDVNTLAAINADRPDVFESTHSMVLGLIAEGAVDGLRIDHVDGLRDPQGYLEGLAERAEVPVWVEKILEGDEELPSTWPVEGTTGYEFAALAGGLLLDPDAEGSLTETYARFTGTDLDLERAARDSKMLVMRQVLIADVKRLFRQAAAVLGVDEEDDEEAGGLMSALAETIAAFDVYRTYVRPDGSRTTDDERLLLDAIETARRRASLVPGGWFDRLADVLVSGTGGERGLDLLLRFQQTTGPVMAKGMEDTLFYRFNRLVALNEVGGDPGRFGTRVADFHAAARRAAERWPRSMLATSTHDTKRSEDVRARLAVLSEIPEEWAAAVERWHDLARRHRSDVVDANTEYLLYQTLVGAHPLDEERAWEYMLKAAREAKLHTSWLEPDEDYESALESFVRALVADPSFAEDLDGFVETFAEAGRINSLALVLLKLTYPGVPDTYRGTELWDLSLVDPDNRRPVDYDARVALRAHVEEADAAQLWSFPDDGGPKMLVTTRALQLRRRLPDVFLRGAYTPLEAEGEAAGHVVSYLRGDSVSVIVPRLNLKLAGEWGDTTVPLPEGKWRNELTGERVYGGNASVLRMLDAFPVALLSRTGD